MPTPLTRRELIAGGIATGIAAESPAFALTAPQERHGMAFAPATTAVVGTSAEERIQLAKRFRCDATWLNDDMEKRSMSLPAYWIDRSPVTNAQYYAYVEATKARPPWSGGVFPIERADHPVVGVSWQEADRYARWLGKRLPKAEEWEAATRTERQGLFPWGNRFPGAIKPLSKRTPRWDLPGTEAVGTGKQGVSIVGMEDFYGQVCEWTETTTRHHGALFSLLKGASWLHHDPVNYRTAACFWAMAGFYTPWIGFRCALDGTKNPMVVPRKIPAHAPRLTDWTTPDAKPVHAKPQAYRLSEAPDALKQPLLSWSLLFLDGHLPELAPVARSFALYAPAMGPYPICLFLAETITWNDKLLVAGLQATDPPLAKIANANQESAYVLDFKEAKIEFSFVSGDDYLDLRTQITNKTATPGNYNANSCFSLTSNPIFYDCEMLRTYALTPQGQFEPLRNLPRKGDCIRWIAPTDLSRQGGELSKGVMAVVSRDGRWTFASERVEHGREAEVLGNTWLNCVHTNAPVTVPALGVCTTIQRLYFLSGGLNHLKARLKANSLER